MLNLIVNISHILHHCMCIVRIGIACIVDLLMRCWLRLESLKWILIPQLGNDYISRDKFLLICDICCMEELELLVLCGELEIMSAIAVLIGM